MKKNYENFDQSSSLLLLQEGQGEERIWAKHLQAHSFVGTKPAGLWQNICTTPCPIVWDPLNEAWARHTKDFDKVLAGKWPFLCGGTSVIWQVNCCPLWPREETERSFWLCISSSDMGLGPEGQVWSCLWLCKKFWGLYTCLDKCRDLKTAAADLHFHQYSILTEIFNVALDEMFFRTYIQFQSRPKGGGKAEPRPRLRQPSQQVFFSRPWF